MESRNDDLSKMRDTDGQLALSELRVPGDHESHIEIPERSGGCQR